MSYSSENTLPIGTAIKDVRELISLLGYRETGTLSDPEYGRFEEYWFFDETDYRSWSGVELSISPRADRSIIVSTRSPLGRSYYDLVLQNKTISLIRRGFGGTFITDEGTGRYLRPGAPAPPPAASGSFLAFSRFGGNLTKAMMYIDARSFPKQPWDKNFKLGFLLEIDPRTLSNNLLVPFLVASLEDYFKSTFIALLRYSPKRETFFKSIRLSGEYLLAIADGAVSVEGATAEILPFQRISAICRHFDALDPKLDLAGALRKPYHRRAESLFDEIERLVLSRHDFIHRAALDLTLTDERIKDLIYDLEAAVIRCYCRITRHYGWFFERTWFLGKRGSRNAHISGDA
jgi:hypothetical protein